VDEKPTRSGTAFGVESRAQAQESLSMLGPALQPTVFLFCRLGDMVMLTPLLNLLHQRYRRPCRVIGTGSWTPAVYTGNPDVSDVWSFHRHVPFVFAGAWPALRRALRDTHPGPIYVCEPHYRQLPRIRRMLKMSGVDPRRCEYLFDEPGSTRGNLVDLFVRFGTRTPPLLRAADYPPPPSMGGPRVYVLDSERAERDAWLRAQGWYGRELILIQPGNHRTMGPRRARWRRLNTDDKWWPLERWAALLQRVHEYREHALLVLNGSAEEVPMLEELRAAAKLPEVTVVANNLRQLFALCEVAHSMISVDTGPAHAAGALGLPLVVLFGAQPAMDWLPRSPSGSAVLGVGGPPHSTRADQVSVDAVFAAWRAVIQKVAPVMQDSPAAVS
jgi:heptosyltransferase-2/heptosyltransferase-3